MMLFPPGLGPPVQVPQDSRCGAAPMEIDLAQPMATKYQFKLAAVIGTKFFDLEEMEAALSPDMTHMRDSVMTVLTARSMADMKRLVHLCVPRRVRIYIKDDQFELLPPRARRRNKGRAKMAIEKDEAPAAQPTAQSPAKARPSYTSGALRMSASEKIAQKVSVMLTLAAHLPRPPFSVWTAKAAAKPSPHPWVRKWPAGQKPPSRPRPARRPSTSGFLPPRSKGCGQARRPSMPSPPPALAQPHPVHLASETVRIGPSAAPEWRNNLDLAKFLRSVATMVDGPPRTRNERNDIPILIHPPPGSASLRTSSPAYD